MGQGFGGVVYIWSSSWRFRKKVLFLNPSNLQPQITRNVYLNFSSFAHMVYMLCEEEICTYKIIHQKKNTKKAVSRSAIDHVQLHTTIRTKCNPWHSLKTKLCEHDNNITFTVWKTLKVDGCMSIFGYR
jgi:hypothetical protein